MNPALAAEVTDLEITGMEAFRRLTLGYVVAVGLMSCTAAWGQQLVLTRANATVALEGFAPNIVRVTLSLDHDAALHGPGVGIIAAQSAAGWSHSAAADGATYRSDRLRWHVPP